MKNNFSCEFLRGDGRCKRKNAPCNRGHCVHYLRCQDCNYRLYTESQEPCYECYFRTKETMIEYIKNN